MQVLHIGTGLPPGMSPSMYQHELQKRRCTFLCVLLDITGDWCDCSQQLRSLCKDVLVTYEWNAGALYTTFERKKVEIKTPGTLVSKSLSGTFCACACTAE